MGGRDHSEKCDKCGYQRGGLENLPCQCVVPMESALLDKETLEDLHDWLEESLTACEIAQRADEPRRFITVEFLESARNRCTWIINARAASKDGAE